MFTAIFDSIETYVTDVKIYLDAVEKDAETFETQFADIFGSIGLIGASLKPDFSRLNFFNGCIYRILIYNTVRTVEEILFDFNNNTLPETSSQCAYNEYINSEETCSDCGWVCNEEQETCDVNSNKCSICSSSLCSACTGFAVGLCTACKSTAILENGECICPHG